jgi:chorismate synthase
MAGAIARKLLNREMGVRIVSYTASIGGVDARVDGTPSEDAIYGNDVRCPDAEAADDMRDEIVSARGSGDTLGGVVQSVASGIPPGMGEPIYNSLESDLAAAAFSIPSVKGVEFGSGFAGARSRGSENNDPYTIQDGTVRTTSNNSGGVLGGISTGMDITMRVAFKPASSIAMPQKSVDTSTMAGTTLRVRGRHDPCVVPRAAPVVDSMMSLVLADHAMLLGMIGPVVL